MTLDRARILATLQTRSLGRSLEVHETTDSTNDDARAAGAGGAPHGHVVVADAQRRGRGRRGRPWSSPPGTDLYFSIFLRVPARESVPRAKPGLGSLSLAVGLAIADGISRFTSEAPTVKWPNDVLLGDRKVAGILIESATHRRGTEAVAGIGLNVNRSEFDPELRDHAAALCEFAREPISREALLAVLLREIERRLEEWNEYGSPSIVRALRPRLAWRGDPVQCERETDSIRGTLVGMADDGSIELRTHRGVERVYGGTLRRAQP